MKRFILLIVLVILAVVGVLFFANKQMIEYSQMGATPTPSEKDSHAGVPTLAKEPTPTIQPESASGSAVSEVKIFLIAIDDGGKKGEKIGCGDSVIAVTKSITPTKAPLTAALKALLAIKTREDKDSELYSALYQSNLSVDSVIIQNNAATVKLSGTLSLGGACDDPRVEAQLRQTILQFPTVRNAVIYINNKPLRDVLSEK